MRGIAVDHATIQRWVFKFAPLIESQIKKRKNRVGSSWRIDETYKKVSGVTYIGLLISRVIQWIFF